ncbi:MAG TPA: flavodoxin family protein [Methanomassiliicoccales archaeon]|nr:flavodoxin family protein [Methanomassiliicoccales archaeon]
MKTLVTYMTVTGNTKRVADAIYAEVNGVKDIKPMDEVKSLEDYDLVFIGFPIMRFGPPDPAKAFIEKNAKGKKVALFMTHAMWSDMEPLKGILAKCKDAANCAKVVGMFDCQGEMSEALAKSLLNNSNPEMQKFGQMRAKTMGNPDAADLTRAKTFVREMTGKA